MGEIVKISESISKNDYDFAKSWLESKNLSNDYFPNQEGSNVNQSPSVHPVGVKVNNNFVSSEGEKHIDVMLQPTLPDLDQPTRRSSSRTPKLTMKVMESSDSSVRRMFGVAQTALYTQYNEVSKDGGLSAFVAHFHNINLLFDGTINQCRHLVFSTVAPNNDLFTLSQMLKLDDIQEFVLAMLKEIDDHKSRDHWELVERKCLPSGAKTILNVWAVKRKRHPDEQIYKYKARLNAHGGMQRWGVDYWETYALVINWISVRLLLILTVLHRLETKSIDFVLAFPQAKLERYVFMETPYGFSFGKKGQYVLKLKKNLYGLADAPLNWFNKLTSGLESEGFVRSETDQCVFIRNDCIILLYVDDMKAISRKKKVSENLVINLKNKNYIHTDEGSLSKYLGSDVKYKDGGSFELTQPFLIQRVIDMLGFTSDEIKCNTRPTPAVKPLLHKDLNEIPRMKSWNYRTVIGMLTYLQGTARPDMLLFLHGKKMIIYRRFVCCIKLIFCDEQFYKFKSKNDGLKVCAMLGLLLHEIYFIIVNIV